MYLCYIRIEIATEIAHVTLKIFHKFDGAGAHRLRSRIAPFFLFAMVSMDHKKCL